MKDNMRDIFAAVQPKKFELPWLILVALLLSTLLYAWQTSQRQDAERIKRFNEIVEGETRGVARQFRVIEDLLRSVSAMTSAVPDITQATWETYFDARISAQDDVGGLIALQFISTAGNPKSAMTSTTLTRVFLPIQPQVRFSSWSEQPEIATAIDKARLSRRPVLSTAIGELAGLPMPKDAVALVIVSEAGKSARDIAGSVAKAGGIMIAIIDRNALMQTFARSRAFPVMHELIDGNRPVYATAGIPEGDAVDSLSRETTIDVGQRPMRLRVHAMPTLEATLRNDAPRAILFIGLISTMLLGGLIWLLTRLRGQAESLAASMTRKLQDQTKFTEDLIEFNPSPIFRKDESGRFVSVNRAWELLAGRDRRDIMGKTYHEFQQPDVAEENERRDRNLLGSDSGYESVEAHLTNADSKQFETIIAKQVLRGSDGKVTGLIGTITDVTPIKQLERELARRREQLDLVIRSSQQGIWDVELTDGGSTYFSERFREILRYQGDAPLPGIDWHTVIHPDDFAEFKQKMVQHFKRATPLFDVESRIRCQDGEYIWVRTRAIAQHNAGGRAVRFVGSISDVTDRKLAEHELLEANVRVTEAARAKEAFLATMSHEIRTPLNGVLGMTSLLAETGLNNEQHDYIRLIRASGDTLLRLIDDVLDFSKIESGRMTLESVPVEIVPVVEDAFELVAENAREKRLALLFDMSDDVPFYILGDATRLRQILLNLLSNAIKFTASGEIAVHLSCRKNDAQQLVLEGRVSDTGIGIPTDRIDHLFQPFTQVDASTTRKYGGTGLGLAICRRLTQLMGGDIRVESVDGRGTTMIFTVLTQPARGPLKPYMQRDVAEFSGLRLLAVDATTARVPIQQRRYARWGFDVVVATHATAADSLRRNGPFDVIMTDMVEPSAEATALNAALTADDTKRDRDREPRMASILQSAIPRSELAQRGAIVPLRHEAFILRPAGRARLFDALMRAVLQEPNHDLATRPYTHEPIYEARFRQSPTTGESVGAAATETGKMNSLDAKSRPGNIVQNGSPLKILVAEDNEVNQRVIAGMLKNLGHQCTLVGDGRSAVTRALAEPFDVIMMDIHMPELDGVGAMREIRAQQSPCPPIVAMTAHALPGDREQYLTAGMDDYISKPLRSSEVASVLDRVHPRGSSGAMSQGLRTNKVPDNMPATTPSLPADVALPILDFEQLEDLRYLPEEPGNNEENGDAVGGLLRLFKTKSEERIATMARQIEAGDWAALSETAHSLRGASASMGFPRVASMCKSLEQAAGKLATSANTSSIEINMAGLMDTYTRIKSHYAEASIALQSWLTSTDRT